MMCLPGWSFSDTMWDGIKELNEQQVIIGWSLGGLLAIQNCLLEPERYKKLILINSTPYFSQFSDSYWETAKNDLAAFQEQFLKWVFYPKHPRQIKNWQKHFVSVTKETKEKLLNDLHLLKTMDFRASYQTLKLPILRIQSSEDALIKLEYFTNLPNETHRIIAGSHALPFTHFDYLIQEIREFLCA